MTDEQKLRKKSLARAYAKQGRGRAIMLRKAYQRIDSCDLSTEEIMALLELPCVYCGTTAENRGLDRIDNALPHVRSNVQTCCAPCNFARGDRFTSDEMLHIGKAIRAIYKQRAKVLREARL